MTAPLRLRLSRAKGFNLQALSLATNGLPAVNVARPGPYGNPFSVKKAADVFDCRMESAHYVTMYDTLNDIEDELGKITHIITGGATGADHWAEANWHNMRRPNEGHLKFPANWNAHGRAAGPFRNQAMIDQGRPDLVVAFPGGRGTADLVSRARSAGIEVRKIPHASRGGATIATGGEL